MIFLWLSISCSIGIYFLFKIRSRLNANLPQAIIINYFTAALFGILTNNESIQLSTIIHAGWFPIAILIGILFVVMFYLIGLSSEKAGISITSMATRMSMIFPISISLIFFEPKVAELKLLIIALTLIAVLLAIYRKPEMNKMNKIAVLPFILFIGSGSVDSLVKVAQHNFVAENETRLFSLSLFGISFFASLLLLLNRKENGTFKPLNTIILGIVLGCVNFGSLYFLIKALNNSGIDSSLIFGINNLSIVCISLFIGFFLFKEKLSRLNWIGIVASIICLLLLVNY